MGRYQVQVEKILDRERKTNHWKIGKDFGINLRQPQDPKFPDEIIISDGETNGAETGQIVLLEIINIPKENIRLFMGKYQRLRIPVMKEFYLRSIISELQLSLPMKRKKDTKKVLRFSRIVLIRI